MEGSDYLGKGVLKVSLPTNISISVREYCTSCICNELACTIVIHASSGHG